MDREDKFEIEGGTEALNDGEGRIALGGFQAGDGGLGGAGLLGELGLSETKELAPLFDLDGNLSGGCIVN